jgi:hypothetical protein
MSRKDEREMTTTDIVINDVTFTNFPAWLENGNITSYPIMDTVVADRFAEQFNAADRLAITVDYSKLDVSVLKQRAKEELGIKKQFESNEEREAAEVLLIKQMTDAGLFSDGIE